MQQNVTHNQSIVPGVPQMIKGQASHSRMGACLAILFMEIYYFCLQRKRRIAHSLPKPLLAGCTPPLEPMLAAAGALRAKQPWWS